MGRERERERSNMKSIKESLEPRGFEGVTRVQYRKKWRGTDLKERRRSRRSTGGEGWD